jgi:hypothetical protein
MRLCVLLMWQEIKTIPEDGFTAWDKIVIDKGDITVQELIDFFKSEYKVTCSAIGVQVCTLSFFLFCWVAAGRLSFVLARLGRVLAQGIQSGPPGECSKGDALKNGLSGRC